MKVQIVGAGAVAKCVFNTFRNIPDIEIVNFVVEEDFQTPKADLKVEVLEKNLSLKKFQKIPYIICIGYHDQNRIRERIFKKILNSGSSLTNLIHPQAYVSANVILGTGNVVMPHANIESNVVIGNSCLVWSNTLIGHDSKLGNNIFMAGGSTVGGFTNVNDNCIVGLNATIGNSIEIGKFSILGAGSLVTKTVKPYSVKITRDTELYRLDSTEFNRLSGFI